MERSDQDNPQSSQLGRRRFLQLSGAHALLVMSQGSLRAVTGNGKRIERIDVYAVRYPMVGHFKFFTGPHGGKGRASVIVKITTGDGLVGWGQSVPIAKWSYETLETVSLVLRRYFVPALLGADPTEIEAIHRAMTGAVADGFSTGMPIARAGIDLALHDLAGKRAGKSVAELWGLKANSPLRLSWTLNPRTLSEADELVRMGRARGYRDFNIKVSPDPTYDAELIARVRALVPEAFLWTDANGGYSPDVALRAAPMLAEAGASILEAPMKPNQIEGYQKLTAQGSLPILMDEGIVSPVELREFIRLKMLNGVAMKPSRCGGLISAKRQIELLKSEGLLWVGSGLTDPDVSLAATLQLYGAFDLEVAAALNGPQFITESLLTKPIEVKNGAILPPPGPGLGVEIDEEKLKDLVHRTALDGTDKRRGRGPTRSSAELTWDKKAGESLALKWNGSELWRFNFRSNQSHSFFHPLSLPGISSLTADAPADHVHHHGMWFSWKYINKVNFWENARGKNRPAGRTSWKQPKVSTSKDGSAEVLMELLYTNPDNEDLLSEDRIIRVESPKSDGAYVIHWQSRFTALAETVELDRTPVPEGARGSRPGGYAGLSLRLADLQERAAVTDRGAVDFMASTRYRGRHEVFEYNGVVDGNEVGIAMTDHAENLNAPSPWYAIRSKEMSFIAPAVICYGAHTMKRGDTFSLQYQVHIHHDRWDSNMLQQLRR